ncbi:MAG: cupin domain-containing protein [Candidatus Limnocylindria bacterium]
MGKKISLEHALATDPAPLKAPPAWTNTEVGQVNGRTILHAGGGRLDGRWHRQDSDEFLLVVTGQLTVEFDAGPLTAGPGEAILIAAGERHRTAVPEGCLLLSVEAVGMKRFEA